MTYSGRQLGRSIVVVGLLGLGVGYRLGTGRQAMLECREKGMQQLFIRDFPEVAAIKDSTSRTYSNTSMGGLAAAQNLATKIDYLHYIYRSGITSVGDYAKDLADPAEVGRLGKNARKTVEQACSENSNVF